MAGTKSADLGRTLETGTVLGSLTLVLAATGILLSPTVVSGWFGRYLEPGIGNILYIVHLAAAVLLVVFTVWHLVPFAAAFVKKVGQRAWERIASIALLTLIVVEIGTGVMLYLHAYGILEKQTAVYTHLAATFLLVLPLLVHAARGTRVWLKRRTARADALVLAEDKGKAEAVRRNQARASRRAFLRMTAYATAGVALAFAIGSAAREQLRAWRLNSIGRTPPLTKDGYRLKITGLVERPIELTFAELLAMPSETIHMTHHCVEGWTYEDTFTGVRLSDVLARAGGVKGDAKMLVFKSPERSTDFRTLGQQYTTNFPYTQRAAAAALVVYRVGTRDLPDVHGFPVRLMTPEKWGYKACKWLTEVELSPDPGYMGYWERAGYHNVGDYPGPIFRD